MAQRAQSQPPMSLAEFLDWEDGQHCRHEFIAGDIVAMTGGTAAHNLIVQNVTAAIRTALRMQGSRCGTFSENLKVLTGAGDATYPDVVVICDDWSLKDTTTAAPAVIVEILSETTERDDRGRKWFSYQTIPSLRHYVLMAQDAPSVEVYSRRDDGGWRYAHVAGLGERAELSGIGVALALEEVFRDVL